MRRGASGAVVAVVGTAANETNRSLVAAWLGLGLDARLLSAAEALAGLREGDVALGRLDVLPTLDGVEPGLLQLLRLERRDRAVRNAAFALLGAHDKLLTARLLRRAGLPRPWTIHVRRPDRVPPVPLPVVVKPRFGSWGRDVVLCTTGLELRDRLCELAGRSWFRRHGALIQEFMPSRGRDLRLIVAGGEVVGALERRAPEGEWRTNVSLGASKHPARPSPAAVSLGLAAAAAVGADLVGVDLLPLDGDRYAVIELNGAVDFDREYDIDPAGAYVRAAEALELPGLHDLAAEPSGKAAGVAAGRVRG
jgi:[lysine-biosynthesis-protein LysW]--L-2-aminoadipate ligase